MVKVISIMSGKGGVGKSSISLMTALILSENHHTLLIDFDICGPSIIAALGVSGSLVKTEAGFKPIEVTESLDALSFGSILGKDDVVIWRGPKKRVFLDLFFKSIENYDYVVVDTPPGISEEHGFLVDKNTQCIVVTTPQNISLSDAQRCIEFCISNKIPVAGIIENMAGLECECCNGTFYPLGSDGGRQLAEEYGLALLCSLQIDPAFCDSMDRGEIRSKYSSLNSYQKMKKVVEKITV